MKRVKGKTHPCAIICAKDGKLISICTINRAQRMQVFHTLVYELNSLFVVMLLDHKQMFSKHHTSRHSPEVTLEAQKTCVTVSLPCLRESLRKSVSLPFCALVILLD